MVIVCIIKNFFACDDLASAVEAIITSVVYELFTKR